MGYCRYCGHLNPDDAKYCALCGQPMVIVSSGDKGGSGKVDTRKPNRARNNNTSWVEQLNKYVGNDRPAELNWKLLFTDVFTPHTVDEAEEIFICGTKDTTPPPSLASEDWPHPWLYSRVLLMFGIAFLLLWICCDIFGNSNAIPGLIAVGSFTVPLSTVILFLEVNAWRNVSLYKVLQTFLVGGCASLVATLFLFQVVGSANEMDFFGAMLTGIIEEIGKAVIVYYFLKHLGKLSILSGLLVGASVGAGFAAFESAGYAMNWLLQGGLGSMLDVIFLRGLLAPGGHVTWAAITGAAFVLAAKARGEISTSLFGDSKFLRLFILPVALHALWDSPLSAIGSEIYLVPIILTFLVWIIVLILINMGLAEVNSEGYRVH